MQRPGNTDVGLEAINFVYDTLQIDPEWTVWDERGFSWWGSECRQRVWADSAYDSDEFQIYQIHAQTDVIDGFSETDKQLSLLGTCMDLMSVGGFIRSASDPSRILLASRISVHLDTLPWKKRFLAGIVAIQAAEAAWWNFLLPQSSQGWTAARSAHPISGRREVWDDMINVGKLRAKPLGKKHLKRRDEEMTEILSRLQQPPCLLSTGNKYELAAEFPFPSHTTLLEIKARDSHGQYGSGISITAKFSQGDADPASKLIALENNELEINSRTRTDCIGSWYSSRLGLGHCAFYPDFIYQPGLLIHLCFSHINRIGWYTEDILKYNWKEHYDEALKAKLSKLSDYIAPKHKWNFWRR